MLTSTNRTLPSQQTACAPTVWLSPSDGTKPPTQSSSNSNGLVQSTDLVTTISLTDGADLSPSTASILRKTSCVGIVSTPMSCACGTLTISPGGPSAGSQGDKTFRGGAAGLPVRPTP